MVLDPGHGGRDPGAVGTVIEKEITLGWRSAYATCCGRLVWMWS
ncbi:N-acetylmuramoyl-L-alanine amidase [Deinococcus malanensis]